MHALLEADNVSIQFHTSQSTVEAVRGVSFSLYEGETLAIVGESGCGKSVLCKSILRLLPHSGTISNGKLLFQGQDLAALSEREMDRIRGREIAMVFQDPMTSLNPTMSVGKQIMEVILQHEKVSKKEARERALFWMQTVGLDLSLIHISGQCPSGRRKTGCGSKSGKSPRYGPPGNEP